MSCPPPPRPLGPRCNPKSFSTALGRFAAVVLLAFVACGANAAAPDAPQNLQKEEGYSRFQLTWDADAMIRKYEYRYKKASDSTSWSNWEETPAGTSTGTDNVGTRIYWSEIGRRIAVGTNYKFQVRAVNAAGEEGTSSEITVQRKNVLPAPPRLYTAIEWTKRNGEIELRWRRPVEEGSRDTSYQIRWRIRGGSYTDDNVKEVLDRLSVVVDGLTNNVPYDFQMRAVNAVGSSNWWPDADENLMQYYAAPTAPPPFTEIAIIGLKATYEAPEKTAWTSPQPTLKDAIGEVTWTLEGDDVRYFRIDEGTGVLTLLGQDFNADGDNIYEVTVKATEGSNMATFSLTVTVTEIEITGLEAAYSVPEKTPWMSPQPPALSGASGMVMWSISDGADKDLFTIDAATGVLTLLGQDYDDPKDAGEDNVYEVTVTATDENSNTDSHDLTVTVTKGDRTEMLLRGATDFGRTVSLQVMDAVGQRLDGNFNPDDSSATLGGRRLNLSGGRSAQPGPFVAFRNEADVAYELRNMSLREFLLASAFHLSAPGEADQGRRWSVWARGATTSVASGDARSSFGGDVSTAVLGADCECDPVLAGMAVAYSKSSGEAEKDARAPARANSSLTSAYPYLKFNVNERLSVWGALGYGKGRSGLTADGNRVETDIEMKMGAFGARRELSSLGDYELAVESDVLWMSVNSDAAPDLAAASADASRLRLRLETSRRHELASGALLTPSLELGLRHDGGDAETGAGLELGGRLLYTGADRRLALDANVRVLIVHADREYKERGFGGSVRLKPNRSGHGLSLNLSSSFGDAASGVDDLWSHRLDSGDDADSSHRLDVEIGYGMNAPGGGMLTPYVGAALPDDGARVYRSGWRLARKPSLNLSLEASARETVGGSLEQGLMLRAELSAW